MPKGDQITVRFRVVFCFLVGLWGNASAQTPWPTTTTWGNSSLSAPYIGLGTDQTPGGLDLNGDGLADLANATSTGSNFTPFGTSSIWECPEGNFDGTGRASVACVTLSSTQNNIKYAQSLGSQAGAVQTQDFSAHIGANDFIDGDFYTAGCHLMDLNGDGRDDIVCPVYQSGYNFPFEFAVWLATGDLATAAGFQFQLWPSLAPQVAATARLGSYCVVGDFNGDGLKDLACISPNDLPNGSKSFINGDAWITLLSTGTGFVLNNWNFTNWQPANQLPPGEPTNCQVSDFNGDGISDIACPVFLLSGTSSQWHIAFGGGSVPFSNIQAWSVPSYTDAAPFNCPAADLYGTGFSGLLCWNMAGNQPTTWTFLQSTGTSFTVKTFTTPSSWNLGATYSTGSSTSRTNYQNCIYADFNGDGIIDIACPISGGAFNMGLSSRPN